MTTESPAPQEPENRGRRLEDIFVLLSVITLWPVVMGWNHPVYQATLYLALIGLLIVLVRRVKRFNRARREADEKIN